MSHILEADGVHFEIGLRSILSNIYIKCKIGEVTCLLGRNGEGKSSLMNIIYGQLESQSKSIRFDGITNLSSYKSPRLIRYLPQFNILPQGLSIKRVFLDFEVSYNDFKNDFPDFDSTSDTKIGYLSGGQRRLIEVYIFLKVQSKFVLLDEPYTHIMPLHIEKINLIMKEEKMKKSFLITDHMYNDCIKVSDKIYVLANGTTYPIKSFEDIERIGYLRTT